jgi:hypothetical protein
LKPIKLKKDKQLRLISSSTRQSIFVNRKNTSTITHLLATALALISLPTASIATGKITVGNDVGKIIVGNNEDVGEVIVGKDKDVG